MAMTNEQKYSEVLKGLGELLADKSITISTQNWQIAQLKEKLASAEAERDAAVGRAMRLDTELLDALCEIEKMKGGQSNGESV